MGLGLGEKLQQFSPVGVDLVEVPPYDLAIAAVGAGADGFFVLVPGALWGVLRRHGRIVVERSWWCRCPRRVQLRVLRHRISPQHGMRSPSVWWSTKSHVGTSAQSELQQSSAGRLCSFSGGARSWLCCTLRIVERTLPRHNRIPALKHEASGPVPFV